MFGEELRLVRTLALLGLHWTFFVSGLAPLRLRPVYEVTDGQGAVRVRPYAGSHSGR